MQLVLTAHAPCPKGTQADTCCSRIQCPRSHARRYQRPRPSPAGTLPMGPHPQVESRSLHVSACAKIIKQRTSVPRLMLVSRAMSIDTIGCIVRCIPVLCLRPCVSKYLPLPCQPPMSLSEPYSDKKKYILRK